MNFLIQKMCFNYPSVLHLCLVPFYYAVVTTVVMKVKTTRWPHLPFPCQQTPSPAWCPLHPPSSLSCTATRWIKHHYHST